MSKNMKKDTVWLVRDARGLTVYEKSFLFVVASRGLAKTYRKTLLEDMGGISTGMLSKVVGSLVEKDLIKVHEGYWHEGKKTQTAYTVKEDVLATFVPAREGSHDERVSSPHERVRSPHERVRSPHGGYKGTEKVTEKVTMKETHSASAPVENLSTKEESLDTPSTPSLLNRDTAPAVSSLQERRSVSSLKERKTAQSNLETGGRAHLENLIEKEHRMNAVWAQDARTLFDDATWREDCKGPQRAALAFFKTTTQEVGV